LFRRAAFGQHRVSAVAAAATAFAQFSNNSIRQDSSAIDWRAHDFCLERIWGGMDATYAKVDSDPP
jgi:hypothetical protein